MIILSFFPLLVSENVSFSFKAEFPLNIKVFLPAEKCLKLQSRNQIAQFKNVSVFVCPGITRFFDGAKWIIPKIRFDLPLIDENVSLGKACSHPKEFSLTTPVPVSCIEASPGISPEPPFHWVHWFHWLCPEAAYEQYIPLPHFLRIWLYQIQIIGHLSLSLSPKIHPFTLVALVVLHTTSCPRTNSA